MADPIPSADLVYEREALAALRKAYLDHLNSGNAAIEEYAHNNRRAKYRAGLLEDIRKHELRVRQLELAEGLQQPVKNHSQIKVRF
ncbi:hypothetical protein [Iodobacter fluviatilis]|uniref:Uncharacterized protein n=1 Tax=Iodobacter fluviatilis TaxID=537 RepID=A0A7G3GCR6_9NEIS|nr:hypothetical protein [Iodobacter fluviatilis]QBC44455.1 hypothetical protein C1H71_13555 [Iodobacter fluviatilis]